LTPGKLHLRNLLIIWASIFCLYFFVKFCIYCSSTITTGIVINMQGYSVRYVSTRWNRGGGSESYNYPQIAFLRPNANGSPNFPHIYFKYQRELDTIQSKEYSYIRDDTFIIKKGNDISRVVIEPDRLQSLKNIVGDYNAKVRMIDTEGLFIIDNPLAASGEYGLYDTVSVCFNPNSPNDAKMYTFSVFWLTVRTFLLLLFSCLAATGVYFIVFDLRTRKIWY
jgi:hypothetical protein